MQSELRLMHNISIDVIRWFLQLNLNRVKKNEQFLKTEQYVFTYDFAEHHMIKNGKLESIYGVQDLRQALSYPDVCNRYRSYLFHNLFKDTFLIKDDIFNEYFRSYSFYKLESEKHEPHASSVKTLTIKLQEMTTEILGPKLYNEIRNPLERKITEFARFQI